MAEQTSQVVKDPFPARTKTASGSVNSIPTEVMSISFADKILLTISQQGRLAQWVHVPLSPSISDTRQTGNFADDDEALPSDLLPMPHLTATTVLGGTVPERDTVAQLLATQIGSAIAMRDPQESRMLVVGTGLQQAELSRDEFMSLVDLALEAL